LFSIFGGDVKPKELRRIKDKLGLGATAFAERIGCKRWLIHAMLNGTRNITETMAAAARALVNDGTA